MLTRVLIKKVVVYGLLALSMADISMHVGVRIFGPKLLTMLGLPTHINSRDGLHRHTAEPAEDRVPIRRIHGPTVPPAPWFPCGGVGEPACPYIECTCLLCWWINFWCSCPQHLADWPAQCFHFQ